MAVGKEVTLSSALGNVTRTVAAIYDDVIAVCTAEEYRRAKMERREPVTIGFPVSAVLAVGPE
jgi:hypothetical protein